MAFNKKKKNNGPSPNLSDVAMRHNIRISNPYGYYPDDVDRVIRKYEELTNTLDKETKRLERELASTKDELKAANGALQKLKLEMTLMEVPDTSAEQDIAMIARLSNINEDVGTYEHEIPKIAPNSESRIPIDVIENPKRSNDIMFDDLVTDDNNSDVNTNTPVQSEHINENNASIYNEYGQLDIL